MATRIHNLRHCFRKESPSCRATDDSSLRGDYQVGEEMQLFRLNVAIGDRSLSTTVTKGILATVETGAAVNGMRKPSTRIVAMAVSYTHLTLPTTSRV